MSIYSKRTALPGLNGGLCWKCRTTPVLVALGSLILREECAWTTTTKRASSGVYCVMTVIRASGCVKMILKPLSA